MKNAEIKKLYDELGKSGFLKERLLEKAQQISTDDECIAFFEEEIIPLAKKRGYDFSVEDLLAYEKNSLQKLSEVELEDVSGGVSLKSMLLTGFLASIGLFGSASISSQSASAALSEPIVLEATKNLIEAEAAPAPAEGSVEGEGERQTDTPMGEDEGQTDTTMEEAARQQVTDEKYILNNLNLLDAYVNKATDVMRNFRFFGPVNGIVMQEDANDVERFQRKHNEDQGDGFGELMRILFPSTGGVFNHTGGAPGVPALTLDCAPTPELMARISAFIYNYRNMTDEGRVQVAKDIQVALQASDAISSDTRAHRDDGKRQALDTNFAKEPKLSEDQNKLVVDICDKCSKLNRVQRYNEMDAQKKSDPNRQIGLISSVSRLQDATLDELGLGDAERNEFKAMRERALKFAESYKNLDENKKMRKSSCELAGLLEGVLGPQTLHFFERGKLFSTGAFSDNVNKANTILHLLHSAMVAMNEQEQLTEEYDKDAAVQDRYVPKYTVERMLMVYFLEAYDTKEQVDAFYGEARRLITHEVTDADAEGVKAAKDRLENLRKLVDMAKVPPITPYRNSTLENGATSVVGRVNDGKLSFFGDTFADCADIAIRHVMNLLLFSKYGNWNSFNNPELEAHLEAFKTAVKTHGEFPALSLKERLELFLYHQSKVGVDAGDIVTRTLWEYVIANMDQEVNLEADMFKITYVRGNYELDTGHVNALKLIYNLAKALGEGEIEKFTSAKTSIEELEQLASSSKPDTNNLKTKLKEAMLNTFALINNVVTFTIDVDGNLAVKRKDVFGTVVVTLKKFEASTKFTFYQSNGHASVIHNPTRTGLKIDALKQKGINLDDEFAKLFAVGRLQMNDVGSLTTFNEVFKNGKTDIQSIFGTTVPQWYANYEALSFLSAVQGEEENGIRIGDELGARRHMANSNLSVTVRYKDKSECKQPIARFIWERLVALKGISSESFFKDDVRQSDVYNEYTKWKESCGDLCEIDGCYYRLKGKEATLVLAPKVTDEEINIPATITNNGRTYNVTRLGASCFAENKTVKKVVIQEGVVAIEASAFNGSGITEVTIPASVTKLGTGAFCGCHSLTAVTFKECSQLRTIGGGCFTDCTSLTKVIFRECSQLETIGAYCFIISNNLGSITIPASVTKLGDGAFFSMRGLKEIRLAAGSQLTDVQLRGAGVKDDVQIVREGE